MDTPYEVFLDGLMSHFHNFGNHDGAWPDDIVKWVESQGLKYFWLNDFHEDYNSVESAQALVEQLAKGQHVIIYQENGRKYHCDQQEIWFPVSQSQFAMTFKLTFVA